MRISRTHAFTLLEILVVITILALTASFAGLNLQGRDSADLASLARVLVTDLRYARSIALVNNTDTEVEFDLLANRYHSLHANINRSIPDSVRLRLTIDRRDIDGARGKIVFHPDGSSSGGIIHLDRNGRQLQVSASWLNGHVAVR